MIEDVQVGFPNLLSRSRDTRLGFKVIETPTFMLLYLEDKPQQKAVTQAGH
jgi:hypothetical protein